MSANLAEPLSLPSAYMDEALAAQLFDSGLKSMTLGGRELLPIVQGGMGVGVSAHRLAGTVAAMGGVGTLSAVDARRHHPDLMARTEGLSSRIGQDEDTRRQVDAANREAVAREIRAAREASQGHGLIAMNVMRAVSDYAGYVTASLEAGVDAVVVGAGLPLDLPDLAQDHPNALLIPILSDARGVQLIVKKWERKKRLPDAIVIEHPRLAGGHLGAAKIADLNDPRFDFAIAWTTGYRSTRRCGRDSAAMRPEATGSQRSFGDGSRSHCTEPREVTVGGSRARVGDLWNSTPLGSSSSETTQSSDSTSANARNGAPGTRISGPLGRAPVVAKRCSPPRNGTETAAMPPVRHSCREFP